MKARSPVDGLMDKCTNLMVCSRHTLDLLYGWLNTKGVVGFFVHVIVHSIHYPSPQQDTMSTQSTEGKSGEKVGTQHSGHPNMYKAVYSHFPADLFLYLNLVATNATSFLKLAPPPPPKIT